MRSRPLAFAIIALTMACHDVRQPTAPTDAPKLISDGAHGGNKDFFFLPPLVSDPSKDPNFEAGQFNFTIGPSLSVEICLLQSSPVDASGNPVATDCVSGSPVKRFPAGTVTLQNPPDGFYQVIWHVAESNLDPSKFYRIRVLAEGSPTPFGVADVDPVLSMKELRNARTGEIIPLNENSTLPIKFRVEHEGGSTLCGTFATCTSKTITNSDPSGFQSVTLDGGAGSVAGASFPNGWLPPGGPQSVVVTIAQLTTAGGGSTTDPTPCHVGLALPQYRGCFRFTTAPALPVIDAETGAQFAQRVRVAVCYELDGQGGLEKFAELWSSGPNEPPHPLDDATDAGLLGADSRNCNTGPIITSTDANPLVQLASASWRRIKSGFGYVFGVKTAFAVDLGLGGFTDAFSNVGPVRTQELIARGPTVVSNVLPGTIVTDTGRVIGSDHHSTHSLATGIGGVPVTFTVTEGVAALRSLGSEAPLATSVTVVTNTLGIDATPSSGGGFAPVNVTAPNVPGTYHVVATAPALGSPVTFTITVVPPPVPTIDGVISAGEWTNATSYGPFTVNLPNGAQTTATLYLTNNANRIFGAFVFGDDLSANSYVIGALRMDENGNGVWDNEEDGLVVQQRIAGNKSDGFFDEFFSCNVEPCQGQNDNAWGGTNDGVTASTDSDIPTVIEFSKAINNADSRDATLTAGQTLRFLIFTNIGSSTSTLVGSPFPAEGWASYTVR